MSELPGAGMSGPLAVHVEGFRGELAGLGYSPRTARDHGYVLAQLSCWLVAGQLAPGQLTEPVLDRFVAARRRKGYRRWRSRRSLRLLVAYLRQAGAIPGAWQPAPDGPLEMLLDGYRGYLVAERRLAPSTVRARVDVARQFLAPRVTGRATAFGGAAGPGSLGGAGPGRWGDMGGDLPGPVGREFRPGREPQYWFSLSRPHPALPE